MKTNFNSSTGLLIRPARDSDKPFIAALHHTTRDDLRLIDAKRDFIETLIEQQYHAQTVGYGEMFPNAMYFIIEMQFERIGQIVVDFGMSDVRLVDFSLIPAARGKGLGKQVVQILQNAAATNRVPLTLAVQTLNLSAKALYLQLGFVITDTNGVYEQMIWYPPSFNAPITS